MSDYVKATNFTAKDSLPSGNSGKIVKGTEIDTELTAVASAIASKANINSPTFTGTPAGPTATTGSNTTQLATTAFVNTAMGLAFPSGGIIMWSGSIISIPTGWNLCDGTNSTPDLRNKFIIGAGDDYAVDDTGGSADAVVVSHTHTASVTDSGHTHGYPKGLGSTAGSSTYVGNSSTPDTTLQTDSATTGISVTNSSTGVSGTNANLPPYYALAYIMKA